MNTDDLRNIIWEDLFRTKASRSIDEMAAATACDVTDVRAAVSHEWFIVADDRVSIAYTGPNNRGQLN